MKKAFRFILKTVKWFFIVFLIFIVSLYFREQRLPRMLVDRITDGLSSDSMLVICEGGSVGLKRGICLQGVKVYDRNRRDGIEPLASAGRVYVNHILRAVRIVDGRFPRLADGYYRTGVSERSQKLALKLPDLPDFRIVLDSPNILGLSPEKVEAKVSVCPRWLSVEDIRIVWPDRDRLMTMDGHFRLDIDNQFIRAGVAGHALQRHIRPLIATLDIASALPYMDAFTEVTEPVPAKAEFGVDLVNNDFSLRLDLKPTMGRYNGVAMSRVEGLVGFDSQIRGTNCNIRLDVEIPAAVDPDGRTLQGRISVTSEGGRVRLAYDAKSDLKFADALAVIRFLSPEDLDMIVCESAPVITVKGQSGVSAADSADNRVDFTTSLKHGSFYGLRLNDLTMDYALVRDELTFTNVVATGKAGGRYTASGALSIPGFDSSKAHFDLRVQTVGATLEELADALEIDLGERCGRVDGECWFEAPAATNFAAKLNGAGSFRITDGHLAQMKLFAGLTKLLADRVPGVGFLVNQSQAHGSFVVKDGVLTTDDLFIEGGLISIKFWGRYDIAKDDLDFTARVQFLKDESLMGKLVHPITWPFTKLLLEFKATGPVNDPDWEYISVIDRIL